MCTCGDNKLALRTEIVDELVDRWRPVPGEPAQWGRFRVKIARGTLATVCNTCARVRSRAALGGGTPMATQVTGTTVAVVMTDVVMPSCMTARFVGPSTVTVAISVQEEALTLDGDALEYTEAQPLLVPQYVYYVDLPDGLEPGEYRLFFVDQCLRRSWLITIFVSDDVVRTLYTRSNDVVAATDDYLASLIDLEGTPLSEVLDALQTAVNARATVAGDLGGTGDEPEVVGIRGRTIQNLEPEDGASLWWNAANNRWEVQS